MKKQTLFLSIMVSAIYLFAFTPSLYAAEPPPELPPPTLTCNCECDCPKGTLIAKDENITQPTEKAEEPRGAAFIKQAGRFGVGLTFGITTGPLNAKLFILDNFSIQLTGPIGFAFILPLAVGGEIDLLYDAPAFSTGDTVDIAWEIGGGFTVLDHVLGSSRTDYFIKLDIGIQFLFKSLPFDLVFAYRPGIGLPISSDNPYSYYNPLPVSFIITSRYYF